MSFKMNAFGLVLAVIVALSATKVNGEPYVTISIGSCPSQLPVMPSFKVDQVIISFYSFHSSFIFQLFDYVFSFTYYLKYVGTWYEIKRFPVFFEYQMSCVTATYGFVNATRITVRNSGTRSGKATTVEGYAVVKNIAEPNKLMVYFPFNIFGYTLAENGGAYNIIDTDYNTYSIVYSCNSVLGFMKLESAWLLSKQRTVSQSVVDAAYTKMKQYGIDPSKFFDTVQTNCQ